MNKNRNTKHPHAANLDAQVDPCRIGIEIGEEGYDVCNEFTGTCPIQGVQSWEEARELQEKMTAVCELDLSLEEKRQRMVIDIGEEGYEVCDGATGDCPIQGIQTWDEAVALQKKLYLRTD